MPKVKIKGINDFVEISEEDADYLSQVKKSKDPASVIVSISNYEFTKADIGVIMREPAEKKIRAELDPFSEEIKDFEKWWKICEKTKPAKEPEFYGWRKEDTKENHVLNDLLGFVPMPVIDGLLRQGVIGTDGKDWWIVDNIPVCCPGFPKCDHKRQCSIKRFQQFMEKKSALFIKWGIDAMKADEMFKAHQPV